MSNWFRRCMIRCIMSSFPATRETKKHGMFRWKLSGSTAATTTISSELFYGLGTSISWVNIRGTLIDCSRLALLFAYNWIYWPLFYVLVIGFWTPSLPMIWQPKFLHFFPPPMASPVYFAPSCRLPWTVLCRCYSRIECPSLSISSLTYFVVSALCCLCEVLNIALWITLVSIRVSMVVEPLKHSSRGYRSRVRPAMHNDHYLSHDATTM